MMRAFESAAGAIYRTFVVPVVRDPLTRQRIRLIWYIWGYWHLLRFSRKVPLGERLGLLRSFLRIDWHILHSHSPSEIAQIVMAVIQERRETNGTFVEAGCWNGGSSAKFSHICALLGYQLHIYDSFQGVEDVTSLPEEWDYSGQYATAGHIVQKNLELFGRPEVCTIHEGWFADTLAREGAVGPVRVAYIDCDIAKGTFEALQGIAPRLTANGLLFSQDYHITPVRNLLSNPATWARLHVMEPQVRQLGPRLAVIAGQWPSIANEQNPAH
jgi:O-methyltransferase